MMKACDYCSGDYVFCLEHKKRNAEIDCPLYTEARRKMQNAKKHKTDMEEQPQG